MKDKTILVTVSINRNQTDQIPTIYVQNEEELQTISLELGKILGANINRLSNGLILITSAENQK